MAEAQLIPGATQVFADVLEGTGEVGSGSVTKLFAGMKNGKYALQDIVKVLDSLEGRLNKDLIAKMFNKASASMSDARTALTRFWEEVNSSGGTDLLIGGLNGIANSLKDATKWIKENKDSINGVISRVKVLGKALWDLKWVLIGLYAANKMFSSTAASGAVIGGLSRIWGLLTRAPVLPVAPMSVRIANFFKAAWKGALTVTRRSLPVMGLLFIEELVETLMGREGWLSAIAANGNPLIAWLAKLPLLVGETIKNLALGAAIGAGWFYNLLFGDDQEFAVAEARLGYWFADLNKTMEKYRIIPDSWTMSFLDTIDPVIERLKIVYHLINAVGSFDPLHPVESWRNSSKDFAEAMRLSKGVVEQGQDGVPRINQPLRTTIDNVRSTQSYMPSLSSVPFMMKGAMPSQQGSAITSPTFNLTINAQGNPEDIKRIASETFMDQLQSTMYGTLANFQSGQ